MEDFWSCYVLHGLAALLHRETSCNPTEIIEYLGLNCNESEIKQSPCAQNFVFRKTGHAYDSLEDFYLHLV